MRDRAWAALDGVHVLRGTAYIEKTARMDGELVPARSTDELHSGHVCYLKVSGTFRGFNGQPTGLSFKLCLVPVHIPGVKTDKDIAAYETWKQHNVFDYRKSLPWRSP